MANWINEVPDHLKTQESCIEAVEKCAWLLKYVPDHFKTQEMCNAAVHNHSYTLQYVPDKLKTQEMCERAVEKSSGCLKYVPDHFKTEKTCIKAVKKEAETLEHIPDHFKAWEIYIKAVEKEAESLEHVPEHFKTQEMCKSWSVYPGIPSWLVRYSRTDEIMVRWQLWWWGPWVFEGYQKRKVQKAKIKEELLAIAWHPSRYWDWCIPKDEKKNRKIVFDHLICWD